MQCINLALIDFSGFCHTDETAVQGIGTLDII